MNNDVVAVGFNLNDILGKSEEDAEKMLAGQGYVVVVSHRDGLDKPVPAVADPKRVQLTVNHGVVDAYKRG